MKIDWTSYTGVQSIFTTHLLVKITLHSMLSTIAIVLIIFWILGIVTGYTIGSFIHILLVIAIIMILIRLIRGKGART